MQTKATETTYEAPDPKIQICLRIPKSVKEKADGLVRLWRLYAKVRGDDAEEIDLSYVSRRVYAAGVEQAWAEFGTIPHNKEAWEELESKLRSGEIARNKGVKKHG